MAVDKKISQLTSLAQVDVDAALDVLPIVDTSAVETKKITVSALVGAGASAGLTSVDINSGTIDGTSIGASSASTGAFTTLTATGNITSGGILQALSTVQSSSGADLSLNANGANRDVFLKVNGTTLMTVQGSTSSVGIGTTSPTYKLDVFVTTNNGIRTTSSAGQQSYLGNTGGEAVTGTLNNYGFGIITNGSIRGYFDSSGNLGIGTTSPGSKLDVKGTLRLSGSTSGYVGLSPAAAAGSTTYTLPSADGTTGQFLSTNGTGTLSWASASAGGGAQDYIVQSYGIV